MNLYMISIEVAIAICGATCLLFSRLINGEELDKILRIFLYLGAVFCLIALLITGWLHYEVFYSEKQQLPW